MRDLFRSVMFGGRDLLMQADDGKGGGGAPGADDDKGGKDENDDNDDNGDDGDEGDDDGEEGDNGEEGDKGGKEDEIDPLDQPMFSKRQVAGIVSGRVKDIKGQFANHDQLNEMATMLGEILGAPNFETIVTNLRGLHAQHRAKAGQPPAAPQYQAPSDTKRLATAAEFDNSFIKNPEFADATLFRDEIIDMALNGFSLAQAYWAVAGPLAAGKKAEAAAKNATQVAQNKQKQNKHKQVTPGGTGSPGKTGKPVIPANIVAMAKKIGMDPEEYVAWSNVSTLDQAQALRGKK